MARTSPALRTPRSGEVPAIRDLIQNLDKSHAIDDLWKDTQETLKKVLENKRADVDAAVKRVKELRDTW